jgi:type VI secretion system protein ImpG
MSMNHTLLNAFRHELLFLREVGAQFASAYPEYAHALKPDAQGAGDPLVERLLEGIAFLTAKTACRLNAEGERLFHDVLQATMPDLQHPMPPAAMVELKPLHSLSPDADSWVPRGSTLRYQSDNSEDLFFRSVASVQLLPLQLRVLSEPDHAWIMRTLASTAARHLDRELVQGQVLRAELRTLGGQALSASVRAQLPIHFCGPDGFGLWAALTQRALAVVLMDPEEKRVLGARQGRACLVPCGWRDDEALLPEACVLAGPYRLLREWAHWPQRFAFAQLAGLPEALSGYDGDRIELWWFLPSGTLQSPPQTDSMRLFCTPAVNIEKQHCEPIVLNENASAYAARLPTHLTGHRIVGIQSVECRRGDGQWHQLLPLHQAFGQDSCDSFSVRVEPRWTAHPSQDRPSPDLEWLIAPSLQTTKDSLYSEIMTVQAWTTRKQVAELVSRDATGWRLEYAAPVLSAQGVGGAVPGQALPVASSARLRAAVSHVDTLLHLPSDLAAQALRRWLTAIDDHLDMPGIVGLKFVRTTRRVPWSARPVQAHGLQLTLEMQVSAESDTHISGWAHVIAATLARQLGSQAFVMARLNAGDRLLAESLVWR